MYNTLSRAGTVTGVVASGVATDFGARGALGFDTSGFTTFGGVGTGAGPAATAGAATLAVLAIIFAGALFFAKALFFAEVSFFAEALAGFLVAVFTVFLATTCFFAAFFAVFAALFFPAFLAAVFLVFVAFLTFLAALRASAFTAFFADFLRAFVAAFLLPLPLAVFLARAATTNSFTVSKFGNEPALVYCLDHDPTGKPLHSFPDHALARCVRQPAEHRENQGLSLQIVGFGVARGADDLFPYLS